MATAREGWVGDWKNGAKKEIKEKTHGHGQQCDDCQGAKRYMNLKKYSLCLITLSRLNIYLISIFFKKFIVIQLQLYAFSPHPSTPPQ